MAGAASGAGGGRRLRCARGGRARAVTIAGAPGKLGEARRTACQQYLRRTDRKDVEMNLDLQGIFQGLLDSIMVFLQEYVVQLVTDLVSGVLPM